MNKISEIPEQTPIAEKPVAEMPVDPWRCEECGSLEVFYLTWVDSNTDQIIPAVPGREDLWCNECSEHTWQVRESELMSDTIEPWWKDGTTEENRKIITGLNPENFSSKDDCKAFHDACDMWWHGKTNGEKIRLWRQTTAPEEK